MCIVVPILLYHSIDVSASSRFRRWTVSPPLFDEHIRYLKEHYYTPMTVTQFIHARSQGAEMLGKRPVIITFDDGLADFYTGALPTLVKYGFVATLYITAGYVGKTSRWLHAEGESKRPMLTWRQIADVNASNIECGAHSYHHFQLDILPERIALKEISQSKTVLEQRLGQAVETFAYPHGYYSLTVRRLVEQAGFSSACGVKHAMSTIGDDRFGLARVIVQADTSVAKLGGLLQGEGLSAAPQREQIRTKAWRYIRRTRQQFGRNLDSISYPGSGWSIDPTGLTE